MKAMMRKTSLKTVILIFIIIACAELFGATRLIQQSTFVQEKLAFEYFNQHKQDGKINQDTVRESTRYGKTVREKNSLASTSLESANLSRHQNSEDNNQVKNISVSVRKAHKTITTALEHLKQFPFQPPPLSNQSIFDRTVFRKAQKCLLNSSYVPSGNLSLLHDSNFTPPLDLEDHYFEIMNLTAPLRNVTVNTYLGYSGPWLENAFINEFCCDKPLSFFGGIIPLFVQWTDLWHLYKERWHDHPVGKELFSKLRKDVIYLAVSQHADGIYHKALYISPDANWNLLIFSGGGYGHAPIPLFLQEQQYATFNRTNAHYLFVFAGTGRTKFLVRKKMFDVLKNLSKRNPTITVKFYSGEFWQKVMRSGLLNLAPRGYGRSSFRIVEAIQMGLIPVYLYDDHDWSPYKGTPAHVGNFGYAMNISDFDSFVHHIARELKTDPDGFLSMLEEKHAKLARYRDSHYTVKGLMQQIRYFVQGDPHASINCQEFPRRNYLA